MRAPREAAGREQRALLTAQVKPLERELRPTLVLNADVQHLLWIPGVGKVAAFTLHLEIDGIARPGRARLLLVLPPGPGCGARTGCLDAAAHVRR